MRIVPSGGALGAEVYGVDISQQLDDTLFHEIYEAWLRNIALVFRNQNLTDSQLITFSRRFGDLHVIDLDVLEYQRQESDNLPEIEVISNIQVDGKPIGALGSGEATWHTDMSMYEEPAAATFLYALEVPPTGGNTRFANLQLAYELLSDELKGRIDGLYSIHDMAYTTQGTVRRGFQHVTDKRDSPGARHPVVRTHPETGNKSIYLGRKGYGYILGLSVQESDALLDQLWEHMTQPQFVWEHTWNQYDLLLWDNRCSVHSRGAFDADARRLMHRTSVKGGRPT